MTTTALHPWSLALLRPDLSAYLDANPLDHQFRLVAADELEGEGWAAEAERMRWMARAGRVPHLYKDAPYWGWFSGYQDRQAAGLPRSIPHRLPDLEVSREWGPFLCDSNTGRHRTAPTRQAAEDALIAFLLRFDRDPFTGAQ